MHAKLGSWAVLAAVVAATGIVACSSADSTPAPAAAPTPSADPPPAPVDSTPPPAEDAGPPPAPFVPTFPQVENAGGPVIKTPKLVPIVFKGDPLAAEVTKFGEAMAKSTFLPDVGKEYGVGALTTAPTITVETAPATKLTSDDIEAWLKTQLTGTTPAFGAPDSNALYALFYPPGVTIDMGQGAMGQSCQGYGGYHSEIDVNGTHVGYAVLPRCSDARELTIAASHELFEWATDPFPMNTPAYALVDDEHWAWQATMYGELGDLCTFLDTEMIQPADLGYTVQRMWSNDAAKKGAFPCAPNGASRNYFQAIPRVEDRVDALDYRSRESLKFVKTNAVKLKPNDTKTIAVLVYASAPTQDIELYPMTIEEAYQQPSSGFAFHLSKRVVNSGETVQLTVTAPKGGGTDFLYLYSKKGDAYYIWSMVATTDDQVFPPGMSGGVLPRGIRAPRVWRTPQQRAALLPFAKGTSPTQSRR